MKELRLKTLLRKVNMPLSDKLRIDAGRPFIQTLIARVYVALALVAIMLAVTNKHKVDYSDTLIFGEQNKTVQTIQMVSSNSKPELGLVTKNDII